MKEKHVLGCASVVASIVNPWLGVAFLGLTGWTYYEEYSRNKTADRIMGDMIRSNNRGLRRLVGDEAMDAARKLQKDK